MVYSFDTDGYSSFIDSTPSRLCIYFNATSALDIRDGDLTTSIQLSFGRSLTQILAANTPHTTRQEYRPLDRPLILLVRYIASCLSVGFILPIYLAIRWQPGRTYACCYSKSAILYTDPCTVDLYTLPPIFLLLTFHSKFFSLNRSKTSQSQIRHTRSTWLPHISHLDSPHNYAPAKDFAHYDASSSFIMRMLLQKCLKSLMHE
jgi:hypothetical protein